MSNYKKGPDGKVVRELNQDDDIYTCVEWQQSVKDGYFNCHDGSGAWIKNGQFMTGDVFDDVFGAPPEGATHVVWYNK